MHTVAQNFANEPCQAVNPDSKVARNVFHHLLMRTPGKKRDKLKIRSFVLEIRLERLIVTWSFVALCHTWRSHFAVRQPGDCKNSDLTLSFFLPLPRYFLLLLSSSLSPLGEFHIRIYNSLSYLLFFPSFSSVSLRSIFLRISSGSACNKIPSLPFLLAASGAGNDGFKTDREIAEITMPPLIPAHHRMYRASKGGHCTFSGAHTISGPAAVISSSLALLIFPKTSIFLVALLPLTLSSAYVFLFLFRSIDLHDLPFLRLLSSTFRSPFPAVAAAAILPRQDFDLPPLASWLPQMSPTNATG